MSSTLLHRIQNGLFKHAVELVHSSNTNWPIPNVHTLRRRLQILVLDASFNPPTIAHLALANSQPPPGSADEQGTENYEYDAKLLLLSVRNADKTLKAGDATYLQRLEMLEILARDLKQGDGTPSNVAIAMIDEPTFVGKSKLLQAFLAERFTALAEDTHTKYSAQLNFILGFDTLERLVQPRYYGSKEQMLNSLRQFFSPEGDDSRVVCAHRASSSYTSVGAVDMTVADEFISSGRVVFFDIGDDIAQYSSSETMHVDYVSQSSAPRCRPVLPYKLRRTGEFYKPIVRRSLSLQLSLD
ncbi:hypothetical protein H0H93_001016 [Arthromyces matolae]|nr:hypothetical protein H0H93_001016 [Arthromyces matolae]